jgi:hypothetical protein
MSLTDLMAGVSAVRLRMMPLDQGMVGVHRQE